MSDERSEYMTVKEAGVLLGVTRAKMAQLIRDGVLHAMVNPLNRRVKLIPRGEVEALARLPRSPKKSLPAVA